MTIRFAPARNRTPYSAVVMRKFEIAAVWTAANDNGPGAANDEILLTSALRHFGDHGLRAASTAADSARAALAAGDEVSFEHWLSVCRMLDRRLADRLAADLSCAG